MGPVVLVLFGIFACAFTFSPLIAMMRQKIKIKQRFKPLDLSRLPAPQAKLLKSTVEALANDEFYPEAYVCPVDQSPKTHLFFVVLANRNARNSAVVTLTAPVPTMQKPAVPGVVDVTFQTRFSGGTLVETHNSNQLAFTPPLINEIRTFLPAIKDLHRLYQTHCFMVANLYGNNLREGKHIFEESEAADYIQNMVESCYEAQVENGYLRPALDKLESVYRLTPKGAYLITWCNMFPVTLVRWVVRTIREKEVLADFQRSSWNVALR